MTRERTPMNPIGEALVALAKLVLIIALAPLLILVGWNPDTPR